ncbi:l-allo-threonine aldolase [Pseudovirgaria hyperparasitica]|uniref:L-allo-threonine aldolase n=1 Tax=Pseudovirgaria hyperparasitica TaxID=470096 RepID=A0A6A6W2K2_9PEZI|nr:l-allo-threonine aldolase [Pseudovirgaria hyperparasitica]KAF2756785.1 l-allo-threonine aldolase [Pseudovirgaria hyperparasitica]
MYAHANAHSNSNTNTNTPKPPNDTTPSSPGQTAWSTPGRAARDFRSDTITTPTASMLSAITHTTLLDDCYVEDPTTNELEALCARLTAHESALFVLSGTMGNQVALRTHLGAPPHAVLLDARSHIMVHEAGGLASLSGALAQTVLPANSHHLTLPDITRHAVLTDDIHSCPTRIICLENTLHGTVMPLAEVQRITAWAHAHGILVHLDGARLWEAVASGAGTLAEYASAVDSVSLCFSKGLGAPIGSMLVGNKAFIKRARWIRKCFGGGTRMSGVLTAAARSAIEDTFLGGRLEGSHRNARRVAEVWRGLGGKLVYPVETNMVWLDLEAHGIAVERFVEAAGRRGLVVMGGRLVVHYQICEDALVQLEGVLRGLLAGEEGVDGGAEA